MAVSVGNREEIFATRIGQINRQYPLTESISHIAHDLFGWVRTPRMQDVDWSVRQAIFLDSLPVSERSDVCRVMMERCEPNARRAHLHLIHERGNLETKKTIDRLIAFIRGDR